MQKAEIGRSWEVVITTKDNKMERGKKNPNQQTLTFVLQCSPWGSYKSSFQKNFSQNPDILSPSGNLEHVFHIKPSQHLLLNSCNDDDTKNTHTSQRSTFHLL